MHGMTKWRLGAFVIDSMCTTRSKLSVSGRRPAVGLRYGHDMHIGAGTP